MAAAKICWTSEFQVQLVVIICPWIYLGRYRKESWISEG